jgi:hypothetical protein
MEPRLMGSRVSTFGVSRSSSDRAAGIGLSSAFTRKGDPCLLASPTAELDQLVCRVHKFESFRAALRTGFSQRQIEVATFVTGASATLCTLLPISFAFQTGTLCTLLPISFAFQTGTLCTLLPISFAFQTGTLHRDDCECEAHAAVRQSKNAHIQGARVLRSSGAGRFVSGYGQ